ADRNRSHWSTSKTPSYTKSVSWQHHPLSNIIYRELQSIKSGMHLSGGIFSWRQAEAAGIAREQEVTSN
ncbi:hypothetical protein POW98_15110, partial [Escherichia coli]